MEKKVAIAQTASSAALADIMTGGGFSKAVGTLRKDLSKLRKKHYTPPRSMTPEEKQYYSIHKSLKGFK